MVRSSVSRHHRFSGLLCVCGVLALAGCAKGPGKLYPVSGKVTLDGKPMSSGTVAFAPEGDTGQGAKFTPVGTIGSDGTYEIKTNGKPGAPLGKYKVTVNPTMPTTQEEAAKMTRLPFNSRFSNPMQSPFTVEVVASPQPGAYDLKLTR